MSEPKLITAGRHLSFVARDGWEYVTRPRVSGIVGVVAVTPDRQLILVEQYRPPVDARVIEIPAGLAGDVAGSESEALAEAARRELEEETGWRAGKMTELAAGTVSAGLCDEIVTLFRAEDLVRSGDGGGDSSESIEVHLVPLGQVDAWLAEQVAAGKRVDLKVHAALYFARG